MKFLSPKASKMTSSSSTSSSNHKSTSSASTNPGSSRPVIANYAAEKITTGAGVAIFHLATERVVVCRHGRDGYWFLPKGRRNVGETTEEAACREGFEESGYLNRLLPLPIPHRQPPSDSAPSTPYVTEPIWTQLLPQSSIAQYILFWYAAETVSSEVEAAASGNGQRVGGGGRIYIAPPRWPQGLTIRERIAQDRGGGDAGGEEVYEPVKHEGTGVDEEEALYESYLLPIEEAKKRLKGSIMADVVRRGWDGVQRRTQMESGHGVQGAIEIG